MAVTAVALALSVCTSCKKTPEPQNTDDEEKVDENANEKENANAPESKPKKKVRPLSKPVERFSVRGAVFDMVRVNPGEFQMGAIPGDLDTWDGEHPAHRVSITRPYYICSCEVTQKLWKAVMGNNPSQNVGDDLPVDNVTWQMAQQFNSKLTSMTDFRFTLPTEAQWEYAARGGQNEILTYYSGRDEIDLVAWYKDNSGGKTHNVGYMTSNSLGLYDMSGNVYEWCSDWYAKYSADAQVNPTGPKNGKSRVLRSGCMTDPAKHCRVTNRGYYDPNKATGAFGFRFVINL